MLRRLLVILSIVVLAAPAAADVMVLTDGRILRGEVVEQTSREVSFRCEQDGEWATLIFRRADVQELYEEPGNQGDRPVVVEPRVLPPVDELPDARTGPIVVIPLTGQVGGLLDGSVEGTFDAEMLDDCLGHAESADAQLVVLDIDSPGGYVAEMEAICETIIRYHPSLRIVAWPREAFSAAAIIALTCQEMIVRSDTRIGAAVLIRDDGGEITAVDAKFASPHHARQRQFMAASGQPYDVVAAMTIQETELWWSPQDGFATRTPSTRQRGWERVDGETTVLTLTGEDALRFGLAPGAADDLDTLIALAGVSDAAAVVAYGARVLDYNRRLDERVASLLDQFGRYFNGLSNLADSLARLIEATRNGNEGGTAEAAGDVRQLVRRIVTAGTAIQRAGEGERPLARRANLPDRLVEQIEDDLGTLADLRDTLRDGTPRDLAAARRRIRAIMETWREMLR